MKSKFLALALMAMAFFAASPAQAGVVLSNMGANGLTDTSSATNTDILNNNWLAAVFTTGASAQQLDWVSIVGFNNDSGLKYVAVFADDGGSPGTFVADATAIVSTKNVYQFNFSGANLTASTSYWVLPEVGLSWYMHASNTAPSAQNSSGFSYLGIKTSTDSGSSWNTSVFNYTLGVSTSDVPPVPEPALTSLVCLGGIAFMRRRMKK